MQLIIPMAGRGERFRQAGYLLPKPLIPVHGRAMVEHVIGRFPGVERVLVLPNADHLDVAGWDMRGVLGKLGAEVVPVPSHREGPVRTLQLGARAIDPDDEVVVAMCDLDLQWDFAHYRRWVGAEGVDGAVVCYRGFHPHLLRWTRYAYLKERGLRATAIQEKGAFTDDPIGHREWCSNGIYGFRSGAALRHYVEVLARHPERRIEGELFVSQVYQPMIDDGLDVGVYETPYFCQWGNPEDLAEYEHHARGFAWRARPRPTPPPMDATLLVPMAGLGTRFGTSHLPKPLIPVGGRPMAVAAALELPRTTRQVFVQRADMPGLPVLQEALADAFPGCTQVVLEGPTDGQAITVLLGLQRAGVDLDRPLIVGTCDNGLSFDDRAHSDALIDGDALVWTMRRHPAAIARPEAFGWLDVDEARVLGVRVKAPPADPRHDPALVGVFSFRTAGLALSALQRLVGRDARVRGEVYLDSVVDDLLAAGHRTRAFEVGHYHGWGTPEEHQTYGYWQGFFHREPGVAYTLGADPSVAPGAVAELEEALPALRPPRRPAPWPKDPA